MKCRSLVSKGQSTTTSLCRQEDQISEANNTDIMFFHVLADSAFDIRLTNLDKKLDFCNSVLLIDISLDKTA